MKTPILKTAQQTLEDISKKYAPNDLVDEKTAAEITGLGVASLRRWRHAGGGPTFYKISCMVRYQVNDLISFLGSREKVVNRGL